MVRLSKLVFSWGPGLHPADDRGNGPTIGAYAVDWSRHRAAYAVDRPGSSQVVVQRFQRSLTAAGASCQLNVTAKKCRAHRMTTVHLGPGSLFQFNLTHVVHRSKSGISAKDSIPPSYWDRSVLASPDG